MARSKTIGDYVSLQRGTTYKGSLVGKPGPALLGLGSIHPGGGFRADYKTYGGECPEKLMLYPGDLFVSLKGATKDSEMIGSIARVPTSVSSGRLTQDTVKLAFREPHHDLSAFLYWLLRTPHYRKYCAGRATGSAVVALSREDFLNYPVPPLSAGRTYIVSLLEDIESRIELNRRMNETLEAMARAIFKSWFVDFDPVRARAEGRQPSGMDADTAALFPDSIQESEVGKVPTGWEVEPVLSLAKLLSGGTPKTDREDYWRGDILWASAKDVSQCRDTFLIETERTITDRGLAESSTQIIPAFCTIIVARGATTGRMVLLGRDMAMNQTCYALATTINAPFFLYCLLRNEVNNLVHTAHGSVFDTITTDTFAGYRIPAPPKPIVEAFESQVTPMFHRILANTWESSTLRAIRDALLPKLISGEVRVASVEAA